MVTLPTVILTVFVLSIGVLLFYHFYSQSIRDELASTTTMMVDCLDLTVRGDYQYENGILLKGNMNITDSTMLYKVKEKHCSADISLCNTYNKTKVCFCQTLLSILVSLCHTLCKLYFFIC